MAGDPPPRASPSKQLNGTINDASKPASPRKTAAKTPTKGATVKAATSEGRTPTKAKTPTKTPTRTPRATTTPSKGDDDAPGRSSKRVAASLAAARSAPRKKPRTSLPSFDEEVFGTPPSASTSTPTSKSTKDAISSEVFRANERLRRQREARNFKFEGDANAPRTTRSGRVVGKPTYGRGDDEESRHDGEDEYGGVVEAAEEREEDEVEEEAEAGVRLDVTGTTVRSSTPTVAPLPVNARPHVLRILATLTGSEGEPAPFDNEEDNEALQGLVSLLRGTVERGEGNSALITGPRGVGKTRVSQNRRVKGVRGAKGTTPTRTCREHSVVGAGNVVEDALGDARCSGPW